MFKIKINNKYAKMKNIKILKKIRKNRKIK